MAPVGVLLVNLGSPDDSTTKAVRRYLDEFLGDRYVVDTPRLLWWFIRKFIILPTRPKRSAHAYSKIWTTEGSPLIVHSKRQRALLAERLGPEFHVELGMRYGNPSIASAVANLKAAGCERVVLMQMFPQVSRATNGTARVEVERVVKKTGLQLTEVAPYFDDPSYIEPLAQRLREEVERAPSDHILLSFHGLPERFVDELGDPYRDHCEATAAALAKATGLRDGEWTLTYQSRFGREEWLKPATADVILSMIPKHKHLLVACPGFPADCLETLEEIGITARDTFVAAGGEELRMVPCLNDSPAWIEGMAALVRATAGAA